MNGSDESGHVRVDDTWERSYRKGLTRRLTLRRADGDVYLDRWGLAHESVGRVLLHRMEAPDPGIDLHDHPWWFVTIPLLGSYTEQRAGIREAPMMALIAEAVAHANDLGGDNPTCTRGVEERRRWLRPRLMRLTECHTITHLHRRRVWTLVIGGPRRRKWGFYLPSGYVDEATYDVTVRAERRDLWSDQNAAARPWDPAASGGSAS